MFDKRLLLIIPIAFIAVVTPFVIMALMDYNPGSSGNCDCTTAPLTVPHSHGGGLETAVTNGMQLILNVSSAAELYQVVDGKLQLCGDSLTDDMKHVTVDVIDARLMLGERLPVNVALEIRRADTGEVVVQAAAPAMYAPGHGYHFGDNFILPGGADYAWAVTVSPVEALRQGGAQDVWLEPVTWDGEFSLNADGTVTGKAAPVQLIGDFSKNGLHVTLGYQDAMPDSRYFVVDVTDHAVNYEEKLPGADVTLTFRQDSAEVTTALQPVISPVYGFHYGANIALEPGTWNVTVDVAGLDFLRHAGAAVSLPRGTISGELVYTAEAAQG
jgi:hypothetical protein